MPRLAHGPGENSHSVSVKREGPLGKAEVSPTLGDSPSSSIRGSDAFNPTVEPRCPTQTDFQVLWQHTAPSVFSQKSHLEFQHIKPVKACCSGQDSCGSLSPWWVTSACLSLSAVPKRHFWEPENLRAKPENCSLQEPEWVIFKIIKLCKSKILTYFGANFVNSR